jgi:DNA-binding CsgD family transcriptional regulator
MTPMDNAVELAERCKTDIDTGSLVRDYLNFAKSLGFACGASGAWMLTNGARYTRFYFNTCPLDWRATYERRKLHLVDPFLIEASRSSEAFLYTEKRESWLKETALHPVIDLAEGYGWREIMGVLIHGPFGYHGIVSLGSFETPRLAAEERLALELASRRIHNRCRAEPGFGLGPQTKADLSPRQIECMRWSARGKSDTDIADLMGLSKSTVHFHIEEAKKKLAVRTRVEAVARLVLDGFV